MLGFFQKTGNQILENCFTDEQVVPRGMKWARGVPVGGFLVGEPAGAVSAPGSLGSGGGGRHSHPQRPVTPLLPALEAPVGQGERRDPVICGPVWTGWPVTVAQR